MGRADSSLRESGEWSGIVRDSIGMERHPMAGIISGGNANSAQVCACPRTVMVYGGMLACLLAME